MPKSLTETTSSLSGLAWLYSTALHHTLGL